jgi:hypothetical protein
MISYDAAPSNTGFLVNESQAEKQIARRDWILLPLLGLLTITIISVCAELVARRTFGESATGIEDCLILTDPAHGVRGIPNSVCSEKSPESPMIEIRLDGAGYRSGMESTAKSPGTYRIVMIGSSLAMGERVPFDKTLAALLPVELSRHGARKIELYNEGMAYGFARNAALRFKDALDAQPDLILWVLTPLDIERAGFTFKKDSFKKAAATDTPIASMENAILKEIRERGGSVVIGKALRHWLYEFESQKQYIHAFLNRPDEGEVGFLKRELSPQWQAHVSEFDSYAADIEQQAQAAGVPFAATFAPNRVLAAMISLGDWPAGYDPYQLDRILQSIIVSHGGIYIDILPDFRTLLSPEHFYYPLDGHPDAQGQAVLADLLAKELLSGAVPELKVGTSSMTGSSQRN